MTHTDLFTHVEASSPDRARVRVDANDSADHEVEPRLFGKFCEHLGNNVYQGMDAEVLFNPTFGEWHFRANDGRPSGGFGGEHDPDRIRGRVAAHGRPLAYPEETDPDALLAAYRDGLAFGWQPAGEVTTSPDTGPNGNRAQRIEPEESAAGVVQETRLPLHRVSTYEFRVRLRAADRASASLAIRREGGVLAETTLDASEDWTTIEGTLALFEDGTEDAAHEIEPDAVHEIALTGASGANLVIERLLLYPADHVNHADPEVVEYLRDSDLPLLRWPGGNFVSGYDWTDGIGSVDDRPERRNPAWGGLEPNLFGTDEFVAFCEAVGCEPTICVNAGDGTPEEAAAWVEYCNGSTDTEMGALRAANGHPEPHDVTFWEVGNELYGPWQVHWSTPAGNADRYERFREAMLDADPDIQVTATGHEVGSDGAWNDVLLDRAGTDVRAISDHILAGGSVGPTTDPDELYEAFMGFSDQVGAAYADLRDRMERAGVEEPKLDVTELQLFAQYEADESDENGGDDESDEAFGEEGWGTESGEDDDRLTPETLPDPETISEALYDACIRHELIRVGEFVEMLTHSATVNHGGGLRKQGERTWANPCHHGRSIGSALAGGTPLAVEVTSETITTEERFGEIDPVEGVAAVDAMAVDHADELVVMVVNRRSRRGGLAVALEVSGTSTDEEAELVRLAGESMHDANSRAEPERIAPETRSVELDDGELTIDLDAYSMVRVTIPTS